MKKTLLIILTVILVTVCAVSVNATETSGKCGDNLTWTLDGNTLTISGTGPMYDYSEENLAPWRNVSDLRTVIIEEGVTSIGAYAFEGRGRGSVDACVAASVTAVGQKAFAYRQSLVFFCGSAATIAADAFDDGYGRLSYVTGWDASDMQSYGGRHDWYKATLANTNDTKSLYRVNEPIKTEDFKIKAFYNGSHYYMYVPRTIQCDPYDNTVCGAKSVKIVADGFEFTHNYVVSDGQSHFDLVTVEQPEPQYYSGVSIKIEPAVTAGSFALVKGVHYTLSYTNNIKAESDARITVTGIGEWEGLSETVSFRILKYDIANAFIECGRVTFAGEPMIPTLRVYLGSDKLKAGTDYVVYYQNNVNIGKGMAIVVGIGNCCGYAVKEFTISNETTKVTRMKGAYNGTLNGTLNDQVYYQEAVVTPGVQTFQIDSTVGSTVRDHYAYYVLYRMEGETPVQVTTKETDYGHFAETEFVYDFSSVYEGAADKGGEIYMLSYAWVDSRAEIYSGVYVMYIPTKVPDATNLVAEQVEGVEDFRRAYVTSYGTDGNVGMAEWTSSDESVATVKDGVVTFKKPGSVTVTAQYGGVTSFVEVTAAPRDLKQCDVLAYDPQTGRAFVYYDGVLLTAGTDYALTVAQKEGVITVTATGRGLFSGQIVREFYADSGKALDHTHSFDGCEDTTCGTCTFTRLAIHPYSEQWTKNSTHHWHACAACGAQKDMQTHTISATDDTVCTVCGLLYTPGDLNGDDSVNEDDAIYLLQHILLPDFFPINQDADYVRDQQLNEDDAIYLLQHVLLPEYFPL